MVVFCSSRYAKLSLNFISFLSFNLENEIGDVQIFPERISTRKMGKWDRVIRRFNGKFYTERPSTRGGKNSIEI